jgi:hypothetical protein
MVLHLAEISQEVVPDSHAVMLLHCAGWYVSTPSSYRENFVVKGDHQASLMFAGASTFTMSPSSTASRFAVAKTDGR